ncbi:MULTISPECIES: transcription elongation factor GreAB [Marinomonas]|uniref:Transcription elongation factor GreAB n=1 Tax=Marinomonas rhodophyticola TaxID=2992803 RepID=A0ABT3KMP1_9GAMM|nr:transcription elongation factor GreAB [Marinomonas sp. KJ51-3]MCW4631799.1 transcription elongation factor GreAB [Marinomonas sp. KJ51-3]
MDKQDVYKAVTEALLRRYETAKWAAKQAHEAATNQESIAENKYDTFGLEASYLAHGQSQRVLECEKDWLIFSKTPPVTFAEDSTVGLWSMVTLSELEPLSGIKKYFFISPCAGGLNVEIKGETVYLVTASTPVGKRLLGKMLGDEVDLPQNSRQIAYEITSIA